MSSVSAVSNSTPATSCYIPIITPVVDMITIIASKILALLGQLFSGVQRGISSMVSCIACEPARGEISLNEVRVEEPVRNSTDEPSAARELTSSEQVQVKEMTRACNEQTTRLKEVCNHELDKALAHPGPVATERLVAVKEAIIQRYTPILQLMQEAQEALLDLRTNSLEEAQTKCLTAIIQLDLAIHRGIPYLTTISCPLLMALFVDGDKKKEAEELFFEKLKLMGNGSDQSVSDSPMQELFSAVQDLFKLYSDAKDRCLAACDQVIHFNQEYEMKCAKIQEYEVLQERRASLNKERLAPDEYRPTTKELSQMKNQVFWESSEIEKKLKEAQLVIYPHRSKKLMLEVTSQEVLRGIEMLDAWILSIKDIHLILSEAAEKNFTACQTLGLPFSFRAPVEHTKLCRFDLENVGKFLEALEKTLQMCVLDRDKCTQEFSRRISELETKA